MEIQEIMGIIESIPNWDSDCPFKKQLKQMLREKVCLK